jgi:protease IV
MRILAAVAILILIVPVSGADPLPGPSETFNWVAYPEAGNPEIVNPAGLSFVNSLRLRIGMAASDSSFEGFDRMSVAFPGGAVSGWWEDDVSLRKFTISSSFDIFENTASFGAGYTWFDPTVSASPFQKKHLFTLGLIVRPLDWFSLGLVRRGGFDLPGDDEIEPVYRAGLALRPLGRNFTVTTDLETGTGFDDYELSAGFEFRPIEGLTVRADAGKDYLSFGMEAGFGHASVSCGALSDDDYSYSSSRGEITLTAGPGPDLFQPTGVFVRFDVDDLNEVRRREFFGSLQPCFTEIALTLDRIASDNSVAGVIVEIGGSGCSLAQLEELRNILQRIRGSGKKVYFYIEDAEGAEYYLASCGNRIWIHPCGSVSFLGLSSQAFFLRDFFDNIGISADFQHIGEYKSASDMLTRSDMSDAQRRATTALLESLQRELIAGVANGTGLEPGQLRTIMDAGPYSGDRAVTAGMVNGTCFRDQLEDEIRDGLGSDFETVSLESYAASIPPDDEWGPESHIAVVIASGLIMRGEGGVVFPLGRAIGSEAFCSTLLEAASRVGVKAIVLRIDSPGGEALASADLQHTVDRIRREIPVIVSMGDIAASGGYHMACSADWIFADRMTLTGSIGVVSGKFSIGGLLDSLGINVEEISTGPMASMSSPFHPYSERERGRVFDLMEDSYSIFVETVARGRDMTFEEVDSIGRGRIWSGADALDIGLIDACGGVVDAIHYAAGLTGMEPGEEPGIRIYPTPSFPGTMEFPGFGLSEELIEFMGSTQMLYLMI